MNKEKTITIGGIEYIVYEKGMKLNNHEVSIYFPNDTTVDGNMICLHCHSKGMLSVEGYQYIRGYQIVEGNQDVGGYQIVEGSQRIKGNQDVRGNQRVEGYQVVKGNQCIGGNQRVEGSQYIGGNQVVGGDIELSLYCKWLITLHRDNRDISIQCERKSVSQWDEFFVNKQTIKEPSDSLNYKKIELSYKAAKQMLPLLDLTDQKTPLI